jgi:hypothetical protein
LHCADGVPKDAPEYAYLKALQDAGQGMTDERNLLGRQSGMDGRIGGPLYTYTTGMRFGDAFAQNRVGTRLEGAAQTGLSVLALAGDGLACTTGIGCTAALITGTVIADNLIAGSKKLTSG